MAKIVTFSRRSTGKQDVSLELQRLGLRNWARDRGHDIVASFTETISGAAPIDKREALGDALQAVRDLKPDYFLVWRIDRLTREPAVMVLVERELAKAGTVLEVVCGAGGGTDATSELVRGILAHVAKFERALNSARVRAAIRVRRGEGLALGNAPFGWAIDGTALVEVPDEQGAIARMDELRAEGVSLRGVCRTLEAEGFKPRGKRWHASTVKRALERAA